MIVDDEVVRLERRGLVFGRSLGGVTGGGRTSACSEKVLGCEEGGKGEERNSEGNWKVQSAARRAGAAGAGQSLGGQCKERRGDQAKWCESLEQTSDPDNGACCENCVFNARPGALTRKFSVVSPPSRKPIRALPLRNSAYPANSWSSVQQLTTRAVARKVSRLGHLVLARTLLNPVWNFHFKRL